MITGRLEAYLANMFARNSDPSSGNRALPELLEHTLFYRDGVSESQFGMVKENVGTSQLDQAPGDVT